MPKFVTAVLVTIATALFSDQILASAETGLCYTTTAVYRISYRRAANSQSYSCGRLNWRRCHRTVYWSQSYNDVHHVPSSVCCNGYSTANRSCSLSCCPVCSSGCYNGGRCTAPNVCTCTAGWTGPTCTTDVNECAIGTHNCDQQCHNTHGSYECSCDENSYTLLDDQRTCIDINECKNGSHNCNQHCNNTVGSYRCSCDRYFDLDRDAQTCLVKSEVAITGQNSLEELDTLSLQCTAIPAASISWLKRSSDEIKYLTSSTRISFSTKEVAKEEKKATLGTLTITDVTEDDAGDYLCEAQSGSESIPATEEINVSINVRNECRVDDHGNSPCQNGGVCIDLVKNYLCICYGDFYGKNCRKQVTKNEAIEPKIKQPPANTTTDLATPINLTCTAEGHPAPTYEWYKDGVLILGEIQSFLYIPEPLPEDRGNYTCKAINSLGNITSEQAKLEIPGILQYSVKVEMPNNSEALITEVLLSIASSNLSEASIYSVEKLNSSGKIITFLITVIIHPIKYMNSAYVSLLRSNLQIVIENLTTAIYVSESISRYDGCDPGVYKGRMWPETDLGSVASITCPCADIVGSLAGRIFRHCQGSYAEGADWLDEVDESQCAAINSGITSKLCAIATNITEENQVVVSEIVAEITSEPENLTAADVSASASILTNLTEGATKIQELRDNYLQIVDNIQKVDSEAILVSQKETKSSSKVLESLESFQDKVILSDDRNDTLQERVFAFETFALQLQEVDPETYKAQTFTINLGSIEDISNISGKIPDESLTIQDELMEILNNATASIQLPDDLLDHLNDCSEMNTSTANTILIRRLSYSVFLSNALFQNTEKDAYELGSVIVAARLNANINCGNGTNFNTPIIATFATNKTVAKLASNSACGVWNKEFGAWETTGCKEVVIDPDNNIRSCECKHLAHFGLLFDLSPKPLTGDVAVALSIITHVGLIVSLLCLTLFTATYLSEKKLRTNIHGQILVNMSLALIGLYVFFMIGGHVTSIPILCGISSALLQYFILAFFGWTAVEAVWLYLKLVKVFGTSSFTSKFTLKSGLPTWLISLLIVTLSVAFGSGYYVNPFYCRATEWPFWFGLLLPFSLIYLFNWVMFVIIMASICKHSQGTISSTKDTSKLESIKKHFTIAITLAVVFGLGWAFGLAATSLPIKELTFTFQILFSLFVGLQGFLIFLLHGIRNKDARNAWKRWFGIMGGNYLLSLNTSSTKASSGGTSGPQNVYTKCASGATTSDSTLPHKVDISTVGMDEENIYDDVCPSGTPEHLKMTPLYANCQY